MRDNQKYIILVFLGAVYVTSEHVIFDTVVFPYEHPLFGRPCTQSFSGHGTCRDILMCPELLFKSNPAIVQNASCGYEGFIPVVCCSSSNVPECGYSNHQTTTISTLEEPVTNLEKNDTNLNENSTGSTPNNNTLPESVQLAQPEKWPWMAILFTETDKTRKARCNGIFISKLHVLVAAHCVLDEETNQPLPTSSLSLQVWSKSPGSTGVYGNTVSLPVLHVKPHESFYINSYVNDIAILKIDVAATSTENIQPICLPAEDTPVKTDSLRAYYATVGFTPLNKSLDVEIHTQQLAVWHPSDCEAVYQQIIPSVKGAMCVGESFEDDNCETTSYGQAVMAKSFQGRYFLVGIMSTRPNCKLPWLTVRVTQYLQWIYKNLA
ncbi:proclotting enzyme-like [Limulus polyphemus]|uniref:Proclotting enzyme-like n=1 Tax=Limulus polyphemus TaxID=6850 RepID=A0ABM1B0D2_LIMPO|nr:proclotting enzyme-like [Limulus polyphemus]